MDLSQYLLLFAVGAAAGMINVMAGGGSSLTLPALIFMGLDSAVANGTNRVAIFIQNIFAVTSFHRENHSEFNTSTKLALWTLPGAALGAFFATRISNEWFQTILGLVLIGVILSMIFGSRSGAGAESPLAQKYPWLIYPMLFGVGLYGGFIQVGVGFILMATLFHLFESKLARVNMHKVFIVLLYTIPALAIFISTGNIDWGLGLSIAAGSSLGGWWAARLAVKKGDKIIRAVLFIALIIMALKLLRII